MKLRSNRWKSTSALVESELEEPSDSGSVMEKRV